MAVRGGERDAANSGPRAPGNTDPGRCRGQWEHLGLSRSQRLKPHPVAQFQPAQSEPGGDCAHDFIVVNQFDYEQFRGDLAGDIVRRGAESARDENNLRAAEGLLHRVADRAAIRHRDLPLDAQTEGKDRLGKELEVRVDHIAEQQLGPGVDDFDAHRFNHGRIRRS